MTSPDDRSAADTGPADGTPQAEGATAGYGAPQGFGVPLGYEAPLPYGGPESSTAGASRPAADPDSRRRVPMLTRWWARLTHGRT